MRALPMWTIVLLVASAPVTRAQSTAPGDSDVVTIRDRENVWAEAIVERDSAALAPMLGSEYVVAAGSGQPAQTRAQALHEIANPADSTHHIARVAFDALRIRMVGRDRAVAEGTVAEVGTNSKGPITERIHFVDTWVRRDRRWVCISSKFTPGPIAKPKAS